MGEMQVNGTLSTKRRDKARELVSLSLGEGGIVHRDDTSDKRMVGSVAKSFIAYERTLCASLMTTLLSDSPSESLCHASDGCQDEQSDLNERG